MARREQPIVELRFDGRRFADHTLDADALVEICEFQKAVRETAEALWRRRSPDQKKLPSNFHACTRLCLHPNLIEKGSAVVPLFHSEITPQPEEEESGQLYFLQDTQAVYTILLEATSYMHQVIRDTNNKKQLAHECSEEMLRSYSRLGSSLSSEECLEFAPRGEPMERMTDETRKRLHNYLGEPREDAVDITGRVLEADVRNKRFQLWSDEKSKIIVKFTEEQESEVTMALKEHNSLYLRVRGLGEFSPKGILKKITEVQKLDFTSSKEPELDMASSSLADMILDIFKDVPDEMWEQIPTDLSHRHDYYLHNDE